MVRMGRRLDGMATPTSRLLNGEVPTGPLGGTTVIAELALFVLTTIAICTFCDFSCGRLSFVSTLLNAFTGLGAVFLRPRLGRFSFKRTLCRIVIALKLTFLAALFKTVVTMLFKLLTTRGLSSGEISVIVGDVMTFVETIPAIL